MEPRPTHAAHAPELRPDRREVLLGGLGLGLGALPVARGVRWLGGSGEAGDERVLVLLQLTGGNDGLSMVVPHGDDAYHAARRATRLEPAEVLRLDGYRGLHPELPRLHRRFQEGGLALVEGVGYPRPNRSHFKALEIWHTADERGRAAGEGWIGRLCEARFGEHVEPNRVVHVGPVVPYSLYSTHHPPASFVSPAGYRWVRHEDELPDVAPPAEASGPLAFLRSRLHDAHSSSNEIRDVVGRYETPVSYPPVELARSLRIAAALVNGGIGTRVVSVAMSGFDTHVEQHRAHTKLMRLLDGSLDPFLADLERTAAGRQALVVAFSEFGRRVAENGSRGTDHGCAGPMLVAGARVKGGLYGEHPSLTELDEGDLVFTTDFRSVYTEAIEACFDVDAERVLGQRYPRLGLV